jgi:DnaJ-class molecular chaperone
MPRYFKNIPKKNMPAPKAPSAEVENNETNKLAIIVDQDGVFLRVEMGESELEESKDFDLFEETVEKDLGTPPSAPKAELQTLPEDACTECGGTGLKNSGAVICDVCGGSGRVE